EAFGERIQKAFHNVKTTGCHLSNPPGTNNYGMAGGNLGQRIRIVILRQTECRKINSRELNSTECQQCVAAPPSGVCQEADHLKCLKRANLFWTEGGEQVIQKF